MLVKAYYQCDIDGCRERHESNDSRTSYGTYIERDRAHTYKNLVTHIPTDESIPAHMMEVTIDICQKHYDIIRNGLGLVVCKNNKMYIRRVYKNAARV